MPLLNVLKTRGTSKIPDYVQLRDEHFVLLAHSRADKPEALLEALPYELPIDRLGQWIEQMPYGEIQQLDTQTWIQP